MTDPSKRPLLRKTDLHLGYTAQEHVDDWDLIDMKGRFYDPVICKFLTPDPFVPNPLISQSWNRYAYVLNNPLSRRDPTGFQDSDDVVDAGSPGYENIETVWAPGINTLEGCLADSSCSEAHVITLSGGGTGDPPPPSPPPNDDGLGGPGAFGSPTNAGIKTTQGAPNYTPKDPLELYHKLDREMAYRFTNQAPFANPSRNKFHIFTAIVLGMAYGFMGGLWGAEALAGAAPAAIGVGGGDLVTALVTTSAEQAIGRSTASLTLQSSKWVSLATLITVWHHVFPQQFEPEFEAAGINIQLFTIEVSTALHTALHGEWNYLWEAFFGEAGGQATAEEIATFAAKLMQRWGLSNLPWMVYK